MQASQGSLTIIDPHGAVKVFWNGAAVPVDMRKVNGQTVDGTGTESDPWGPV